jgi:putative transposase
MRRIDEIYTEFPYYGEPRITAQLNRESEYRINHKRVERLMRKLGLCAVYPKRKTSQPHPAHVKYPYLLNGLDICRPNQVWGTDITFVRGDNVWFYLVAVLDWFSRYVLSWKLSRSLSVQFCVAALEESLKIGRPDIHNSDQGSQFTSEDYLSILKQYPEIRISMDGRGRCFDNIFNERLWRTVKYEEVYLREYRSYEEAQHSLGRYFETYNTRRLHQSLNYQTPAEVYFQKSSENQENSLKFLKVETHLKTVENLS